MIRIFRGPSLYLNALRFFFTNIHQFSGKLGLILNSSIKSIILNYLGNKHVLFGWIPGLLALKNGANKNHTYTYEVQNTHTPPYLVRGDLFFPFFFASLSLFICGILTYIHIYACLSRSNSSQKVSLRRDKECLVSSLSLSPKSLYASKKCAPSACLLLFLFLRYCVFVSP